MHILLIEDHQKLAQNIRKFLELEHYVVSVSYDGKDGFEKAMTQEVDAIILDVNLPGMDGYVLCSLLREHKKNMPILMLTARTKQEEVIRGLNDGADDYLTKPFDMDELLARIRALLRRNAEKKISKMTVKDVILDSNTQEVWKGKRKVNLSPKEYALLQYLLWHRGVVQDRPTILAHVWGGRDDLLFSQTVDVHIAYVRRKLGRDIIQTVTGKGYMIPAS